MNCSAKELMNHIKETETLYKGIQTIMKDLSESAGDTKKYREQISKAQR